MASIRIKGGVYYACITLPNGSRTQRSTKVRVGQAAEKAERQHRAMLIAQTMEDALRGERTVVQVRRSLDELFERIGSPNRLRVPVGEFMEGWLRRMAHFKSAATLRAYESAIRGFRKYLKTARGAMLSLDELSVLDLQGWVDGDLLRGRRAHTVKQKLGILGMALKSAQRQGFISNDLVAGVELPAVKAEHVREPFTLEEVAALLDVADVEWKTAILLGVYAGCRIGDAANMRWESVDDECRLLRFSPQKTRRHGTEVVIPLSSVLQAHLRPLWRREGWMCPGLRGREIGGKSGLCDKFRGLVVASGLEPYCERRDGSRGLRYSFHSLRHTFTSLLANAGVPAEVRMAMAGHLSERAHGRYTHLGIDTLSGAIGQMPTIAASGSVSKHEPQNQKQNGSEKTGSTPR